MAEAPEMDDGQEMAGAPEMAATQEMAEAPEMAAAQEMAEAAQTADAAETAGVLVASNLEARCVPSSKENACFHCKFELSFPFTCSMVKMCFLIFLHNLIHPDNSIAIWNQSAVVSSTSYRR